MKRFLVFGFGFALLAALSGRALAWGAGFTITMTPTGARGVLIDSSTAVLSLGDIAMGGSTRTVTAIDVTSTGTIAGIEYDIKASVTGGAALSTDLTILNTELLLQAKFNSVDPDGTGDDYAATDVVDAVDEGAGSAGADTSFEGDVDVDNLNLYETRKLWCKITLPPATQYSGEQTIAVTITADVTD
ncbi:MAG: hypothetical protein ABIJ15_01135 [bacterium]